MTDQQFLSRDRRNALAQAKQEQWDRLTAVTHDAEGNPGQYDCGPFWRLDDRGEWVQDFGWHWTPRSE